MAELNFFIDSLLECLNLVSFAKFSVLGIALNNLIKHKPLNLDLIHHIPVERRVELANSPDASSVFSHIISVSHNYLEFIKEAMGEDDDNLDEFASIFARKSKDFIEFLRGNLLEIVEALWCPILPDPQSSLNEDELITFEVDDQRVFDKRVLPEGSKLLIKKLIIFLRIDPSLFPGYVYSVHRDEASLVRRGFANVVESDQSQDEIIKFLLRKDHPKDSKTPSKNKVKGGSIRGTKQQPKSKVKRESEGKCQNSHNDQEEKNPPMNRAKKNGIQLKSIHQIVEIGSTRGKRQRSCSQVLRGEMEVKTGSGTKNNEMTFKNGEAVDCPTEALKGNDTESIKPL